MRNFKTFALFVFACAVTLTSCKKNIDYHPEWDQPVVASAALSAKVDGTYTAFTAQATLITGSPLGKTLTIIGKNGDKIITIAIYDFKGAGVYTIDNLAQASYNQDLTPSGSFMSSTGSVIVTSATATNIQGTFNFVAPNQDSQINTTKTVTEGSFNLTYSTM
ncbi:DUF6252 family protein [Pedobacter nototheniae]|uniref:DUF6252 family protein n=1 Tax=Pedobacter nototheniae TaxID=2488994 RepID=UPI0010398114|nr:DUF6252 family protein [Pedobacter nototheniae]